MYPIILVYQIASMKYSLEGFRSAPKLSDFDPDEKAIVDDVAHLIQKFDSHTTDGGFTTLAKTVRAMASKEFIKLLLNQQRYDEVMKKANSSKENLLHLAHTEATSANEHFESLKQRVEASRVAQQMAIQNHSDSLKELEKFEKEILDKNTSQPSDTN
jgi:hypothetical protein